MLAFIMAHTATFVSIKPSLFLRQPREVKNKEEREAPDLGASPILTSCNLMHSHSLWFAQAAASQEAVQNNDLPYPPKNLQCNFFLEIGSTETVKFKGWLHPWYSTFMLA
jgi:hypothetical protein